MTDDLIRRQDAINAIYYQLPRETRHQATQIMQEAPTVIRLYIPEPETAHWEIVTDNGIMTYVSCSKCGYGNYREDVKHWEFCPMCGRRIINGKTA